MRIIIAGAGHVSETLAKQLHDEKHEIVIVDRSRDRLDQLAKNLDVSFLCGDVTDPAILQEADPGRSDVLICLTDVDQTNIMCAALGRALGYKRVIPSVGDPRLKVLAESLSFDEYITPAETVAEKLRSML